MTFRIQKIKTLFLFNIVNIFEALLHHHINSYELNEIMQSNIYYLTTNEKKYAILLTRD